jgi:hypothetical protein
MSKKIDNGIRVYESLDLTAMSPTEAVRAMPPPGTKMLIRVTKIGPRTPDGRPIEGTWLPVDYEWMIRETEASLRPHFPPLDATPEPGTLAWHSRTVLNEIAELRQFIAAGGNADPQVGIALGLRLGRMIEHARVDVNLGNHIREGVPVPSRRRQGGYVRGKQLTDAAAKDYATIVKHFQRWQQSDELQEQYRTSAEYIRKKTGFSRTKIYNHLKTKASR